MARTMTREEGRLVINFRPFESLTGLTKFKTHVKSATFFAITGNNQMVMLALDEYDRTEWLYFPYGSVGIYRERPA